MRPTAPAVAARPATEVVVLGGGVVGTACAWRIAQRGLRTTLIDPSPGVSMPGAGASGAAAGMLAPVSELHYGEEALLRLSLFAVQRYPGYVADLEQVTGLDTGYRECGTLAVALTADDRARLAETRSAQERLGLDVAALTGRQCRALEPMLDPGVSAGTLIRGDHQIDPRRLLTALRAAAEAAGVDAVCGRATPEQAGGELIGVRFDDGTLLRAPRVVLATGAWAQPVVPAVRPVKGQILRLRMRAGEHVLARTVRGVVQGREVYLVPRVNGELVVGATSEDLGFDRTVTAGAVHGLLRDAQALVPAVTELEFTEVTARSRPGTPDNLPLVGESAVAGLVLATGHYRNGILLSGVTAAAAAGLVCGETVAVPMQVCDPGRLRAPAPQTPGTGPLTAAGWR